MGYVFVYIAFAACLISTILYAMASRGNEKVVKFARMFFHLSIIMTISSAAFLLYLIITHQFDYTYVWSYSSRDLPFNLLMSTFYAGQEGSFHLWAFMMAVLGIFVLSFLIARDRDYEANHHTTFKERYEPVTMLVFASIQTMLLYTLILKSPYLKVWESFPGDVQLGFVPEDGRGLNPLLQNFWMTIHPPILFAGFSSLAVPFCFAIAALIKNNYDRWMKLALPWTLFSGMVLGVGIMLGGFWAYGVLGWGGYWGWDPVENSSFVPWIVIIAAIHTLVGEEKTGKFKKTSLILCILGFVLVLYSTFLTRSGILGDASVHSFVDPGQEVYIFLVAFLGFYLLLGLGLILFRIKSLGSPAKETSEMLSRESALFIGAVTLCASALVIGVGTSWPIISKGSVDPAFYNKMNLPLAIMIAAVNGISILLAWKHTDSKRFMKSLYLPITLTVVTSVALAIFAIRDVLILALAATSIFSFAINLQIILKLISNKTIKAGPYIAHLGIMVLFLGIIGSSKYSVEENLALPIDEPKEALGYTLTYKGATPIRGEKSADEKYHFNVVVEKDGKGYLLQPIMFYSEYSKGIMKNPDVANLGIKDIYLAPMSLEVGSPYTEQDIVKFEKGQELDVKGLKIKFIDFDRSKFSQDKMMSGEENIIGAKLEITADGKTQTVIAEQHLAEGHTDPIPVKVPGKDNYTLYLTQMAVDGTPTAFVAVSDKPEGVADDKETLVLSASIKPLINLVWGGTIIMAIGFFIALLNRRKAFLGEKKVAEKVTHHSDHSHSNGNGHGSNGHNSNGHKNVQHKKHQH